MSRTKAYGELHLDVENDKCSSGRKPPQPSHKGPDRAGARSRVPQLVKTREAAEILGRSPNTLKRWRYEGVGPRYYVLEGQVSYDVADLLDFIYAGARVPSVRAALEEHSRGAL